MELFKKRKKLVLVLLASWVSGLSVKLLFLVRYYIDNTLFTPEDPARLVYYEQSNIIVILSLVAIVINTTVLTLIGRWLGFQSKKVLLVVCLFQLILFSSVFF